MLDFATQLALFHINIVESADFYDASWTKTNKDQVTA